MYPLKKLSAPGSPGSARAGSINLMGIPLSISPGLRACTTSPEGNWSDSKTLMTPPVALVFNVNH